MGMTPFGGLAAGYGAEHIGAPAAVACGGAICIAGAIVFRWRLPSLRGEARALIVAQGLMGGEPLQAMAVPAEDLRPSAEPEDGLDREAKPVLARALD
jgi:hypothetical protein